MADDKKISELNQADTLTGASLLGIQGGSNRRFPTGLFQPFSSDLVSLADLDANVGQLAVRTADGWALLANGLIGQNLTSGGAGASPLWKPGFVAVARNEDLSRETATIAADGVLEFPIAANQRAIFRAVISIEETAGEDFRYRVDAPTSPAIFRMAHRHIAAAATAFADIGTDSTPGTVHDVLTASAGDGMIFLEGHIKNGATAGAVQFAWAQVTASAGQAASVKEGSYIEYMYLP